MEEPKPSVISVDPRSLKPKNITRAHHIMYNSKNPTASVPKADQKPAAAASKLAGVLGKKGADTTSPPSLPKTPVVQAKVDAASKFVRKSSSPSCSSIKQLVSDQKPKNVDLSALSRPTLGKFGSISLGDLGRKSGGGNNKQNAKVRFLLALKVVSHESMIVASSSATYKAERPIEERKPKSRQESSYQI